MKCRVWRTTIPVKRYGSSNLFCNKYESRSEHGSDLGKLVAYMQTGFLYAIPYTDLHLPWKLKRVFNLRTRRFIDGRAKPIKPVLHAGVRYEAPHFKFAATPSDWKKCDQCGGHLEAWDVKTGKLLWDMNVYGTYYDPWKPRDDQHVFITRLKIRGDKLIVETEKGDIFAVDLKTREVSDV